MPEPDLVTLELACTRGFADLVTGLDFEQEFTNGQVRLASLIFLQIVSAVERKGGRIVVVNADGTETEITGVLTPCPSPS